MEHINNQLGHHVILEVDDQGEKIGIKDVRVLSASEYLNVLEEIRRNAIRREQASQAERAKAEEEADKQKAEAEAQALAQALAQRYSLANFAIVWNHLKVLTFEGRSLLDGETLDKLLSEALKATPGEGLKQIVSALPEFSAKFEELIR